MQDPILTHDSVSVPKITHENLQGMYITADLLTVQRLATMGIALVTASIVKALLCNRLDCCGKLSNASIAMDSEDSCYRTQGVRRLKITK